MERSSYPIETIDDLTRFVADVLARVGVQYFVTGSQASITYGEPRFTTDVDIVARLGPGNVEAFCNAFPEGFDLDRMAVAQAVKRGEQFNVLHPASGLKADIMPPRMGLYDRYRFERTSVEPLHGGGTAVFCSPEDVILAKLVFYEQGASEKHIRDISGVIKVQGNKLDLAYIDEWAYRLDVQDAWKMIRKTLDH